MASYERILELRLKLTEFVNVAYSFFGDISIPLLCERRGYSSYEMQKTLHDMQVFRLDNLGDIEFLPNAPSYVQYYKDWGFLTESGDFILRGRFCVPIRDIAGNVTALVGWYNDQKKYVTTPTAGFARDAQFFNMDSYKYSIDNFNGKTFLVEGIFDTIAMRSMGYPCIGNMGLPLSGLKQLMLLRYNKVCAIPDNDKVGASVRDSKSKNFWNLSRVNSVFVKLPDIKGIKDIDDLLKVMHMSDTGADEFKKEFDLIIQEKQIYHIIATK